MKVIVRYSGFQVAPSGFLLQFSVTLSDLPSQMSQLCPQANFSNNNWDNALSGEEREPSF